MTILICDVYMFQLQTGVLQGFAMLRDGKRVVWDVGPCCMSKPFRIPPAARSEAPSRIPLAQG